MSLSSVGSCVEMDFKHFMKQIIAGAKPKEWLDGEWPSGGRPDAPRGLSDRYDLIHMTCICLLAMSSLLFWEPILCNEDGGRSV